MLGEETMSDGVCEEVVVVIHQVTNLTAEVVAVTGDGAADAMVEMSKKKKKK